MAWHIIGSDGYIGTNLCKRLHDVEFITYGQNANVCDKVFEITTLKEADFSDLAEGDFVVFLAAISSPDVCEKDYKNAYKINVTGTENFIRNCINRRTRVLFFSSDVVNGATTPRCVDENYDVVPFGKYGEMKRHIEKSFMDEPLFKVFRLSYVYSTMDKFSRYLEQCSKNKAIAEVYDALYRNVIYLEDVFAAIFCLEKTFMKWENTIFNLSGPELLSRKDLAKLFVQNVAPDMKFTPVIPSNDFFEARPNIIATKSLYLQSLLGRNPLNIADAMRQEYKTKD
jgi:dTDP-4-dehydrorhamnose reductase